MRTALRWLIVALGLPALAGCHSSPAAPALSDSPVYRSESEGFRFLVPEGWTQLSNSTLPSGKLDGEVFLVRYRLISSEAGALFQVLCMTDSAADLVKHHAGPSFRAQEWDVVQPPEAVAVNGVDTERLLYKTLVDKKEMTKHVTCFRRNGRVYSFVGLYYPTDDIARQQIERAVDSVIWER